MRGTKQTRRKKKDCRKPDTLHISVKVGVWILQRNNILRKLKRKSSPEICGMGSWVECGLCHKGGQERVRAEATDTGVLDPHKP